MRALGLVFFESAHDVFRARMSASVLGGRETRRRRTEVVRRREMNVIDLAGTTGGMTEPETTTTARMPRKTRNGWLQMILCVCRFSCWHTHTQHWLQHYINQSDFICNGLICIFVLNYVSLDHFGFAFSNSVLLGLGFQYRAQRLAGKT